MAKFNSYLLKRRIKAIEDRPSAKISQSTKLTPSKDDHDFNVSAGMQANNHGTTGSPKFMHARKSNIRKMGLPKQQIWLGKKQKKKWQIFCQFIF